MEVVVEDKQLSLAIGKKGQNVRLAAKLTGWRIDIKSEEEKRKEVEAQFGAMEAAAAEDPPEEAAETTVAAERPWQTKQPWSTNRPRQTNRPADDRPRSTKRPQSTKRPRPRRRPAAPNPKPSVVFSNPSSP